MNWREDGPREDNVSFWWFEAAFFLCIVNLEFSKILNFLYIFINFEKPLLGSLQKSKMGKWKLFRSNLSSLPAVAFQIYWITQFLLAIFSKTADFKEQSQNANVTSDIRLSYINTLLRLVVDGSGHAAITKKSFYTFFMVTLLYRTFVSNLEHV